ncbi:MAG: transposase zinc-binding domain-containing protein [Deltaproteobacteria bacterium]|nr:transposase zinc-binding domain-containing protein [Deltaproteobacteria bacterium]
MPSFVESEMRSFLECGVLAHGFARFRCDDCGTDRLVAFSCKGRGFCPSCGGRRMTARVAHLVDEGVPYVPTRQWVLSLPFGLRFRVAFDHGLARAVLAAFTRAIFDFYEERARRLGLVGARTGTVTVIQRFGGALNLNPHFHTLALDGVFSGTQSGETANVASLSCPTDLTQLHPT